jgi:hypothetical protein
MYYTTRSRLDPLATPYGVAISAIPGALPPGTILCADPPTPKNGPAVKNKLLVGYYTKLMVEDGECYVDNELFNQSPRNALLEEVRYLCDHLNGDNLAERFERTHTERLPRSLSYTIEDSITYTCAAGCYSPTPSNHKFNVLVPDWEHYRLNHYARSFALERIISLSEEATNTTHTCYSIEDYPLETNLCVISGKHISDSIITYKFDGGCTGDKQWYSFNTNDMHYFHKFNIPLPSTIVLAAERYVVERLEPFSLEDTTHIVYQVNAGDTKIIDKLKSGDSEDIEIIRYDTVEEVTFERLVNHGISRFIVPYHKKRLGYRPNIRAQLSRMPAGSHWPQINSSRIKGVCT